MTTQRDKDELMAPVTTAFVGEQSEVDPEDVLHDGKAFRGEPNYEAHDLYMIGHPYSTVDRFPVFGHPFASPMERGVAEKALEVIAHSAGEFCELPSMRSRLYRVTIEEV